MSLDDLPNETDAERAFNRRVEVRLENLLGLQPATPPSTGEASTEVLWSIDSALVAGFDCVQPVQGRPLRIGYAADFSPLGALADVPGSEAVRHLALLVNCSGGVRGRPIEVAVFDVGPPAARRSVDDLVAWRPAAIIGPRLAGPGLRVLQAFDRGVPVVFAASTEPALADASATSFLVSSDGASLADAAARFAIDNGWLSAVTFTSPGPDYGHDPAAFAVNLAAGGGAVLTEFEFAAAASTEAAEEVFAGAVAQLASGPTPAVILTSMPARQLAVLRRRAVEAGIETNWITTNPMALAGVAPGVPGETGAADPPSGDLPSGDRLAADLDGLYLVTSVPSTPEGRAERLDRSFEAATGSGSTNPTAATLAADAMTVIIEAYLRGGGNARGDGVEDSDAIARALSAGLPIEAVGGPIQYTGSGNPARPIHVEQFVDREVQPIITFDP